MATSLLSVEISSPEKQIWQGTAISISSVNLTGPFDVLSYHANFITIIENHPIKINTGLEIEEFTFPNAILYVSKNIVKIYTL